MKPSTYRSLGHARAQSAGTGDVQQLDPDGGASAVLITVEGTNARVTFDDTDPSTAEAPSLIIQKDSQPLFLPVGPGAAIRFCSADVGLCVMQALWLR